MLQLSFDGRRLYVSNSLYSTWDNQFYPELRSWLLRVDCDPNGGMEIDRDFFVDFHDRPGRPGAGARGTAPGRRLHHGDLPVISPTSWGSRSRRPCCSSYLPARRW